MRRREFIRLLVGSTAAAWPLAVRAQHTTVPKIGILTSRAAGDAPQLMDAIRQGLKDTGFVEGQNVAIEYRFAEHHYERLPALAADLVQRQVTMIVATTTQAALAAKAATTTIPVVFEMGSNPVRLGLVASLNRPGGNITGATQLTVELAPKRLQLLHELIPAASVIALLINPTDPASSEPQIDAVLSAAHSLGLELHILNASADHDFDGVFANLIQLGVSGLVISGDAFLVSRSRQLAALAVHHAMPVVGEYREFVAAGGLASYGGGIADAYRLTGLYAGRVLKGEKPADLPVQQATKVELYINLKTAKALGISVPIPILGRADEVIE